MCALTYAFYVLQLTPVVPLVEKKNPRLIQVALEKNNLNFGHYNNPAKV